MAINWDEVLEEQEADEALLPVGDYDILVEKAEGTQASTGSDMIKMTLKVINGPFAGKVLWTNIVLKTDSTGAMRMALRRLAALGVTREWLVSTGAQLPQIAAATIGKTASARVEQKKYNGEDRNEVGMFSPISGGAGVPAPAPLPTTAVAASRVSSSPSVTPDDEPF
jgi:hypothetical protein